MITTHLTFSLPEDHEADEVRILESSVKDGNYSLVQTKEYRYGQSKIEVELNPERWYAIQFHNTKTGNTTHRSEPVFAGTYTHGSPVVFVSSATDGAHYATSEDVYDYAGLEPQDVPLKRVSQALKHARSTIDWRASDVGYDRQKTFRAEAPQRRKRYNAALLILKEAEICLALGKLYDAMSDTRILESLRDGEDGPQEGMAAIGGTSTNISTLADRSDSILYLAALSEKYNSRGEELLSSLDPTSVALVSYSEYVRSPRFKYPFHGWPR